MGKVSSRNNPQKPFSELIKTKSGNRDAYHVPDGNAGDAIVDLGYVTFFPSQPQDDTETRGAFSPKASVEKAAPGYHKDPKGN